MTVDPSTSATVRAVQQHRYGGPEVLAVATARRPTPAAGQVLVRVAASSVNARDWHIMRGEPRAARLLDRSVFRRTGPTAPVRGTDVAGTVEQVGPGVAQWAPGDRVFGEATGAWADLAVADANALARVPADATFADAADATFADAAAVPLAATTALTCLSAAEPEHGGRLLLIGASGGVGTFAMQLARHMGLHVTAVCSPRNADQAMALGADHVIDYTTQDVCASSERYDIVIDLVGNRSVRVLRRLVRPRGTLVLSGGGIPGTGRYIGPLATIVRGQLLARRPGPRIVIPQAQPTTPQLEQLAELMSSGAFRPVVDRTYSLDRAAEAVRYVEVEHSPGKVVILVDDECLQT